MKKLLGWPTASLILVGFAILLFAAPTRFEGSVLVPISPDMVYPYWTPLPSYRC